MSEWKKYQVNEVAVVIMGQSPSSTSYNEEGFGYPFLQGCADFGRRIPTKKFYCTDPKKIVPKGAILISVRAPVGTTNKADSEYCIGRGLAGIVGQNIYQDFLDYKIISQVSDLERVSQGSTFLAINTGDLNNLIIEIPTSLAEQRKIARILSTVDAVIEKTEAAIDKYKAIKAGMMRDLFTRGIDLATGNLRPSYEEAPQLYRQTELGWVPKEWEVDELQKMASITTGDKDTQNNERDGMYPFFVRSQTVEHINTYSYDGEAILTAGDGVGTGKIYHYINGKFDFHQRVYMIYEFRSDIVGKYLFYYFRDHFMNRVTMFSAKNTVDSVRRHMIAEMKVPKPLKVEQEIIAKKLSKLDEVIEIETDLLDKSKMEKQALMSDLLTGKVPVKYEEEKI